MAVFENVPSRHCHGTIGVTWDNVFVPHMVRYGHTTPHTDNHGRKNKHALRITTLFLLMLHFCHDAKTNQKVVVQRPSRCYARYRNRKGTSEGLRKRWQAISGFSHLITAILFYTLIRQFSIHSLIFPARRRGKTINYRIKPLQRKWCLVRVLGLVVSSDCVLFGLCCQMYCIVVLISFFHNFHSHRSIWMDG